MTAPIILVLVRHGESTWLAEGRFQGRGDVPLTDLGRRQAMALGERLAAPAAVPPLPLPDTAPLAIWHSPLRRAVETAQAIHEAREADAPLRPLETLMELSQGEWEGLTEDEVRNHYPRQLTGWLEDPFRHHAPGGESLPAAFERAQRAGRTIFGAAARPLPQAPEPVLGYGRTAARREMPDWTVVVAHDGILRCLLLEVLRLGLEHFWSFPFAPAALSLIDITASGARLRAHNIDAHLKGHAPG